MTLVFFFLNRGTWSLLNWQVEDLEHRMDDLSEDYADKLAEELQFLSNQTADLKKLMVDNKDE